MPVVVDVVAIVASNTAVAAPAPAPAVAVDDDDDGDRYAASLSVYVGWRCHSSLSCLLACCWNDIQ